MASGKILKGADFKIKCEPKCLGQYFFDQAQKFSDRICQIDGLTGTKETFKSVKQRSIRVALELLKRGVTTNDYVILCSGNTTDSVVPLLSGAFVGAKIGSLDPSLSVRDTTHLISIVCPKIIFVEEASVSLIEQSIGEHQVEIVVLGSSSKYATLQSLTKPNQAEDTFTPVKVDPNETGIIFFSSGTTGLPKVICISHAGIVRMSLVILELNIKSDAVLHFTTTYWVSANYMLITSFAAGSYRVLFPKFDAELAFQVIEKYKITFVFSTPILVYDLLDFKDRAKYDTSSIHTLLLGGCPTSASKLEEAKTFFKDTNIILGYGMTEAGFLTCFDPTLEQTLIRKKPLSCGKIVPGIQIKVVDPETEQLLGPNQRGEIRIKSDALMKGYLKMDASSVFTADGFLKTGDIGYYDEDECFDVVDRIKEMFKYKGWHIIPTSIESVLLQHPQVKEAVVFGIPHEIDGDLPSACVIPVENSTVTAEDILNFVNERVSDREQLRGGIRFVEKLPKTPSGKLQRNQIRDLIIKAL